MIRDRSRTIATMAGTGVLQTGANSASALVATIALPVADRGLMVVALTIPAVLAPVVSLGTGNALRSVLPRTPSAGALGVIAAYTRVSAAVTLLGAVAAAGACAAVSLVSDDRLRSWEFLLATAFAGATAIASQQLIEAWFARGRYRLGGIWSAVGATLGLVGLLVACVTGAPAPVLVLAQAAGMAVATGLGLRSAVRVGAVGFRSVDRGAARSLIVLGARSLGLPIGTSLLMRSDRLVLAALVGPRTVATYALAATLAETVRIAPIAAAQLLTADVALRRTNVSVARAQLLGAVSVVLSGALLLVMAAWLVVPVFGNAYASAVPLLAVLLLAELGFSAFMFAYRGLIGGGWSTEVSVLGLLMGALSVPVYAAGSTLAGATGCACACVVLYATIGAYGSVRLTRMRRTDRVAQPGGPP